MFSLNAFVERFSYSILDESCVVVGIYINDEIYSSNYNNNNIICFVVVKNK